MAKLTFEFDENDPRLPQVLSAIGLSVGSISHVVPPPFMPLPTKHLEVRVQPDVGMKPVPLRASPDDDTVVGTITDVDGWFIPSEKIDHPMKGTMVKIRNGWAKLNKFQSREV